MDEAKIIAYQKLLEFLKELYNDKKIDLEVLFNVLSLIGNMMI